MLVALAWPTHVHHETAVDWFTSRRGRPWATAAIVQMGFISVSSNRRILLELGATRLIVDEARSQPLRTR